MTVVPPRRDDGVALMTVLLMVLIIATLSILVLGTVMGQVRPTTFTQNSSRSVFAAEAGLQAGIGRLRTAVPTTSPTAFGDRSKLPCSFTGSLGPASDPSSFAVTIRYYATEPTGMSTSWLADNALPCAAGTGLATTPAFALVSSTGAAASAVGDPEGPGRRTVETRYAFRGPNANIKGGVIRSGGGGSCLRAEAPPVSGSPVFYRPAGYCGGAEEAKDESEDRWVYDTDHALKLASTVNTAAPLCITHPAVAGDVSLRPCQAGLWSQVWRYEDGGRFRSQNTGNTDRGTTCLWTGSKAPAAWQSMRADATGCTSDDEDWGSFVLDPGVGAGAAGESTRQVVSLGAPSQCTTVTNNQVTSTYLVVTPCTHDPRSAGPRLPWAQRWYYTEATASTPVTGPIRVIDDQARQYCLQSPGPGATPTPVVLKTCTGATNQVFVRQAEMDTPRASWLFLTQDGRCLDLGPERAAGTLTVPTIVAASCSGEDSQKWNAPADATASRVMAVREVQ